MSLVQIKRVAKRFSFPLLLVCQFAWLQRKFTLLDKSSSMSIILWLSFQKVDNAARNIYPFLFLSNKPQHLSDQHPPQVTLLKMVIPPANHPLLHYHRGAADQVSWRTYHHYSHPNPTAVGRRFLHEAMLLCWVVTTGRTSPPLFHLKPTRTANSIRTNKHGGHQREGQKCHPRYLRWDPLRTPRRSALLLLQL